MIAKLIQSVKIEGLFGLYSYNIPEIGQLTNASILYGENGVGKSSLLRLVFHLLSAANDKGHRTALLNAEYETLEVSLSSDVVLSAQRLKEDESERRYLHLEIKHSTNLVAVWDHFPKSEKNTVVVDDELVEIVYSERGTQFIRRRREKQKKLPSNVMQGNEGYLATLAKYAPTMFILNAERRLDSDKVADPSDEIELRRFLRTDTPTRIHEVVARSREIALSQALASASHWINGKAIKGANLGSMNVHSVYVGVLSQLMSSHTADEKSSTNTHQEELIGKLEGIEQQMEKHAAYELATALSTREFRIALTRNTDKSGIAAKLLQPYIESLERRLEAVRPVYEAIDRFVTIINTFLKDKTLSYKLSQGFSIENKLGVTLEPSQLSSGEQQLLLLFCYVLTARDESSVFMIDEPEISLNVKWQRQLIQSLLEIAEGADIQFIFASHSVELLTQHRHRVVKLSNIV